MRRFVTPLPGWYLWFRAVGEPNYGERAECEPAGVWVLCSQPQWFPGTKPLVSGAPPEAHDIFALEGHFKQ